MISERKISNLKASHVAMLDAFCAGDEDRYTVALQKFKRLERNAYKAAGSRDDTQTVIKILLDA